uniref:Major facilitator superfamily (MFS) profile domain-containing protein n=1 Tax=Chromera velia CCMP2878 TaxID=1169474 RepID=A0A0G4FK97_9ALVE|eukprot:Cvel_17437.t1-p1 / transcript=Cvel_17437.t1 / gene=Cvel_17437 / organism=Chromera_velia_CCMP2878 / gene_product=Tetracycline resistance protein, class H, putative / transcript_product=Tetracycline resistance protein, class H, putative / location=Cvel_scaffold1390:34043-41491(+) / protein_length=649 / sequence_SO=supercontig / SO=protein_coding / is_pseudo=false
MDRFTQTLVIMVMVTVFIDMMSVSLVIPILPFLIVQYGAEDFWIGILFASYAATQMISNVLLSRAADKYGTKTGLLLSLVGSTVGNVVTGFSFNIATLIAFRALTGLFAGSAPVAQGFIVRVCEPQERPKWLALSGALTSSALLFGPAVAGGLSTYFLELPFFVAGAVAGVNLLFVLFMFKEPPKKEPVDPSEAPQSPEVAGSAQGAEGGVAPEEGEEAGEGEGDASKASPAEGVHEGAEVKRKTVEEVDLSLGFGLQGKDSVKDGSPKAMGQPEHEPSNLQVLSANGEEKDTEKGKTPLPVVTVQEPEGQTKGEGGEASQGLSPPPQASASVNRVVGSVTTRSMVSSVGGTPEKVEIAPVAQIGFATFLHGGGFAAIQALIGLYAEQVFGVTALDLGFIMTGVAVIFILTQFFVFTPLQKNWGIEITVIIGECIVVASFFTIFIPTQLWAFLVILYIFVLGNSLIIPAVPTMLSFFTTSKHVTTVVSVGQTSMAAARVIFPLFLGFLLELNPSLPWIVSGAVCSAALGVWIFVLVKGDLRRKKAESVPPKVMLLQSRLNTKREKVSSSEKAALGEWFSDFLMERNYTRWKAHVRELEIVLDAALPPLAADADVRREEVTYILREAPKAKKRYLDWREVTVATCALPVT